MIQAIAIDTPTNDNLCLGCVYYPPNLPPDAYDKEDWDMLQARTCTFEYQVGDADCQATRKTASSLVNLENAA